MRQRRLPRLKSEACDDDGAEIPRLCGCLRVWAVMVSAIIINQEGDSGVFRCVELDEQSVGIVCERQNVVGLSTWNFAAPGPDIIVVLNLHNSDPRCSPGYKRNCLQGYPVQGASSLVHIPEACVFCVSHALSRLRLLSRPLASCHPKSALIWIRRRAIDASDAYSSDSAVAYLLPVVDAYIAPKTLRGILQPVVRLCTDTVRPDLRDYSRSFHECRRNPTWFVFLVCTSGMID